MTDTPIRDREKIIVRLPDGLRERIAAAAKNSRRSMNSEVVAILEKAFLSQDEIDARKYETALRDVEAQLHFTRGQLESLEQRRQELEESVQHLRERSEKNERSVKTRRSLT